MARGDYPWREPKKPKKHKRKVLTPPAQVLAQAPEPEVVPKGKAAKAQGEQPVEGTARGPRLAS